MATDFPDYSIGITGVVGVSNGGTGVISIPANQILVGAGTSPLASFATFVFDGTNLGVGVAAPLAPVHIQAASTLPRLVFTDTTQNCGWDLYESGVNRGGIQIMGSAFATTNLQKYLRLISAGAGIAFYSSNVEAARFDPSGNLAIGNNLPAGLLDVGASHQFTITTGGKAINYNGVALALRGLPYVIGNVAATLQGAAIAATQVPNTGSGPIGNYLVLARIATQTGQVGSATFTLTIKYSSRTNNISVVSGVIDLMTGGSAAHLAFPIYLDGTFILTYQTDLTGGVVGAGNYALDVTVLAL